MAFGYNNMIDGLGKVWKQEGVRGMFRGAGARMCHSAPATAITIGMYDSVKQWLKNNVDL